MNVGILQHWLKINVSNERREMKELESIKKGRTVLIWVLGKERYEHLRDHFRDQIVFACIMGTWLGFVYFIDFVVGPRYIPFSNVQFAEVMHLLEASTVIVWFVIGAGKAMRKELRQR